MTLDPLNWDLWAIGVNGNTIVAAQQRGSLYRSTDNGISWAAGSAQYHFVWSLLWTKDGLYAGATDGFLWKSVDDGLTFEPLDYSGDGVFNISIDSDKNLYAAAGGDPFREGERVWRSSDNGLTWQHLPVDSAWVIKTLVAPNDLVFAANENGAVYVSDDAGDSWLDISQGLSNDEIWGLELNSKGFLFAITRNGGIYGTTESVLK